MPDLSTAIRDFKSSRQSQGLASRTVRRGDLTLKAFLADVGNINTQSIRPQHMDTFWMRHANWAQSTRNTAICTFEVFFSWCRARGHINRNADPMEGIIKRRPTPRQRIIIPQDKFSTFLAEIDDPRKRVATAIGLYLFTRISETSSLRWQDDRGTELEVYRTKTRTIDTLPICAELREELDRWKLAYAAAIGEQPKPGHYIVPGREPARFAHGGRPGRGATVIPGDLVPDRKSALSTSLRDVLKDAGYYQIHEGGHTLRRSGAIALYDRLTHLGHDRAIRIVQAMLGHSSVATTEIYLRLDLDKKVRDDLLAGQPMFPVVADAEVVSIADLARRPAN